jgi:hypothetical protein
MTPHSTASIRIRFSPQLQLIEVFCGDLALTESFEKMVAERQR